ncbi:MerR family transcriptional regulator [soil metagenome]
MTEPLNEIHTLTIGAVHHELLTEFPKITITKIRYLEDEGLVKPERTPAGYRKYSYADVERLRFILAGQRDYFWPLSHIRQMLEDYDNGLAPDVTGDASVRVPAVTLAEDGLPEPTSFATSASHVRLSREELLEAASISADLLDAMEQHGLISRRTSQSYYTGASLAVASLVGEFAEHGLEPRHLRIFRTAADREISLIDQVLAPLAKQRDPEARRRNSEVAQTLASMSVRLHTTLVKNGLSGTL